MNQNIWGSHLWFSLHTITLNYPLKPTDEDKENYKNFFISLKNVIPCSVCKKNYKRHLNEHPIDNQLNSRKDLVYWMIDIHNMVNGEIGKKILSYETVLKKYENVYHKKNILNISDDDLEDKNNNNNNIYVNYIYIFFIVFLLLLIINFVYLNLRIKKYI
jgi:hypothetical protein